MKVFCRNCEYLEQPLAAIYRCQAPGNLGPNWFVPSDCPIYGPEHINVLNLCTMYKERPQEESDEQVD